MSDPIEVVWTKTRWASQRDEMAWREAWAKVKALALFGRVTLRRLADKHGTTVDDIANDACLLKGVRRHPNDEGPFITGELEPWLRDPEPEKEES